MQDLVGIVRSEAEMLQAIEKIQELKARARCVGAPGNREYNPGWHTTLDLSHLLTVSEALARAALERKESRGAHFREDYPAKDEVFGKLVHAIRKGPEGEMQVLGEPVREVPDQLQQIIEEKR